VLDGAGEDIGDGLDAAMRMPGESFEIVLGILVAEVVEEEKRVKVFGLAEAEGALEADACSFKGWFGGEDFTDWAERHRVPSTAMEMRIML
jgi:hypothetical protein